VNYGPAAVTRGARGAAPAFAPQRTGTQTAASLPDRLDTDRLGAEKGAETGGREHVCSGYGLWDGVWCHSHIRAFASRFRQVGRSCFAPLPWTGCFATPGGLTPQCVAYHVDPELHGARTSNLRLCQGPAPRAAGRRARRRAPRRPDPLFCCAKHLGVRRLDAAFTPSHRSASAYRPMPGGRVRKPWAEGSAASRPPHSKVAPLRLGRRAEHRRARRNMRVHPSGLRTPADRVALRVGSGIRKRGVGP
jgi:hypothetical protein